jgi:hypothetical protein
MARKNQTTRNSPYAINASTYVPATDAASATTGVGGSPRNLTGIWEKLNSMCFDVEWTIGTEAGNAIVVTAQLLDLKGRNLGRPAMVDWSLRASDAAGASWGAIDTASDGLTITTGTIINEWNADAWAQMQSDTDGKIVVSVGDTTGADYYKIQIVVGDRIFLSPLITFAA